MKLATEILNFIGAVLWIGLGAFVGARMAGVFRLERDNARRQQAQLDQVDRALGINTRQPPRDTPPS